MIYMKNLLLKSYAKINLCLNIKYNRDDGYHELDMVMVPVELHDSILMSEVKKGPDNYVTVDDFSLGAINYNLATLAIDMMAAKYKFKNKFRVFIHKVIPIKAGMGGGSSNAAFAMKGVNKYLKLKVSDEELMEIAAPLGADIPFFIKCQPSRCQGVGEKLEPIFIKNNYYVLIVKPKQGCSTKDVFKCFDSDPQFNVGSVDDVIKALAEGDDELLAKSMFNTLQPYAIKLVPEIQTIIDLLHNEGLNMVQMSGSGSAVFALSTDKKKLKDILRRLEDTYEVELTKIIK